MNRDAKIGRQRPRCCRPNHDKHVLADECAVDLGRIGLERKLDVNGRRCVFAILDLSLGKRGLIVDAPIDRTQAFVNEAAFEELAEKACCR